MPGAAVRPLYRVSERTLQRFSLAQLHALCASRQLAVLPSADKSALVKVLKAFRDRKGRHRRSLNTPSETTKSSVHGAGSQCGSDDGEEQGWQPRKPEADGGRRHKGKHKRARPPTPSPSSSHSASPSSRSASPSSPPRRPRRRKSCTARLTASAACRRRRMCARRAPNWPRLKLQGLQGCRRR